MITWRGKVKARQVLRGYVLDAVRLRVRFEIYDDAAPTVSLSMVSHSYVWPLEPLRGLPLGQVADLILNVGNLVEVPPDPPFPGGIVGPDPPPLRAVGDALLEDFGDVRVILQDALPRGFLP